MIINASQVDNNKILKGDLCIIGSGPAGLTIASKFAKSNLDIIVIPGGGFKITKKNQMAQNLQNNAEAFKSETRPQEFITAETSKPNVKRPIQPAGGRSIVTIRPPSR